MKAALLPDTVTDVTVPSVCHTCALCSSRGTEWNAI